MLVFRDDCIRVCFILLLSLALFRGVFRTMLNIYDAPSLRKKLIVICEQFFSIISISGFWQVRKYAAALVCKYFTPVDRQLFIQIKRSLQFVNLKFVNFYSIFFIWTKLGPHAWIFKFQAKLFFCLILTKLDIIFVTSLYYCYYCKNAVQ